jgi:tetratricopeptide (TPR) repeat protein
VSLDYARGSQDHWLPHGSRLGASRASADLYFGYSRHIHTCDICRGYFVSYQTTGILVLANVGMFEVSERLANMLIGTVPAGHPARRPILSALRSTLALAHRVADAKAVNSQLLSEFESAATIPAAEMLNQASVCIDAGDFEAALEWLERIAASGSVVDVGKADCLFTRAHAVCGLGYLADGTALYEEAAKTYLATGAIGFAAECYQNVGATLNESRFYEDAIRVHRESIELFRRAERPHKLAAVLINSCVALAGLDRFDEADEAILGAIEIFDHFDDAHRATNARILRANVLRMRPEVDLEVVDELLSDASPVVEALGHTGLAGRFWHVKAELLLRQNNPSVAIEALERARGFVEAELGPIDDPFGRAYTAATRFGDIDRCLAHALIVRGEEQKAFEVYERTREGTSVFTVPVSVDISLLGNLLEKQPERVGALVFHALGPTTHVWAADSAGLCGEVYRASIQLRSSMHAFLECLETNRLPNADQEKALSAALGQILRHGPIASRVEAWSHTFIIPDRVLSYPPWVAATVGSARPFLAGRPVICGVYPAAAFLQDRLNTSAKPSAKRAVIVGNPKNTYPPLFAAASEANGIAAFLVAAGWDVQTFIGSSGNKPDVMRACETFRPSLLVVASHGTANHADPARSSLWLGGESEVQGTLTIGEIIAKRELFTSVECVWLNTYKGATPSVTLLDSQVSLAASLVYAGIRCVAANLWSVYDEAAFAFGLLFFNNAVMGQSLAESVRRAQKTLAGEEISSLEQLPNFTRRRALDGNPFETALAAFNNNALRRRATGSSVLNNMVGWGSMVLVGDGRGTLS